MRKLNISTKLKQDINCTVMIAFPTNTTTPDVKWRQVFIQRRTTHYTWDSRQDFSLLYFLTINMLENFHDEIKEIFSQLEVKAQEFLVNPYFKSTESIRLSGNQRVLLIVTVFTQQNRTDWQLLLQQEKQNRWQPIDEWSPPAASRDILRSFDDFITKHNLSEFANKIAATLIETRNAALKKSSSQD